MKKIIYFTVVLLLSITLIGFSAAEEKAKSDNIFASITGQGVKPNNQSLVEDKNIRQRSSVNEGILGPIDERLLADSDDDCDDGVRALCEIIKTDCCAVSPSNPASGCGGVFDTGGICTKCGVTCAK